MFYVLRLFLDVQIPTQQLSPVVHVLLQKLTDSPVENSPVWGQKFMELLAGCQKVAQFPGEKRQRPCCPAFLSPLL